MSVSQAEPDEAKPIRSKRLNAIQSRSTLAPAEGSTTGLPRQCLKMDHMDENDRLKELGDLWVAVGNRVQEASRSNWSRPSIHAEKIAAVQLLAHLPETNCRSAGLDCESSVSLEDLGLGKQNM